MYVRYYKLPSITWFDKKYKLTLTKAPTTPKLVSLRYSNGRVLLVVCRKGYKKSGICAKKILK